MIRSSHFTIFAQRGSQRARTVFQGVRSQPGWIGRLAMLTVILIIALPILLLVMIALLAGVLVFSILAGFNALLGRAKRSINGFPRRDGRSNVRVISRSEV